MNNDSAPSAAAAAPATPAAGPTPAPRRSGRSHASSSSAFAGSKRSSTAAAAVSSSAHTPRASDSIDEEDSHATDSPVASARAASAPSSKRARTSKLNAAASSCAASSPSSLLQLAQSSPMIRILSRDTGAQFALCEMLGLRNIGRLHRSCRSWRRWLDEGSLGSNRLLQFDRAVPRSLSSCQWARRYVQRLTIGVSPWVPCSVVAYEDEDEDKDEDEEEEYEPEVGSDDVFEAWSDQVALRLLPHLNRLRALQLAREHPDVAKGASEGQGPKRGVAEPLPSLLSSSLTTLVLDVRSYWNQTQDPFTPALLCSIGGFPSLTSLAITSERLWHTFDKLDLSPLSSLPHLQSLAIDSRNFLRCSAEQVAALAACRALTALDVGEWSLAAEDADLFGQKLSAIGRAQLKEGLAALVQGRDTMVLLRCANSASTEFSSLPPSPIIFSHSPRWRASRGWNGAARSLRIIGLSSLCLQTCALSTSAPSVRNAADSAETPELGLNVVLGALQHCTALTSLRLNGDLPFHTAHATLLVTLPRLCSLELEYLLVESLAPLSRAPALTQLTLEECCGLDGEPACMRSMVPALPLLTSLCIENDVHEADEAVHESLTAALLVRLPLLDPDDYDRTVDQSWNN